MILDEPVKAKAFMRARNVHLSKRPLTAHESVVRVPWGGFRVMGAFPPLGKSCDETLSRLTLGLLC